MLLSMAFSNYDRAENINNTNNVNSNHRTSLLTDPTNMLIPICGVVVVGDGATSRPSSSLESATILSSS